MDFDLVVESINKLYSSRDPAEINSIQNGLQQLQKSPDGSQLAKLLLNHLLSSCQFFGALTYAVVINSVKLSNSDDPELMGQSFHDLANETIYYILKFASQSSHVAQSSVVLRKLLSNLSLIFLLASKTLSSPMKVLLYLFQRENFNNSDNNINNISNNGNIGILGCEDFISAASRHPLPFQLSDISRTHLSILITFSTILVEDISKNEAASNIHELVFTDSFQITSSILDSLLPGAIFQPIDETVLTCLNSWINYICYAEDSSTVRYKDNILPFLQYLLAHFPQDPNSNIIVPDNVPFIDKALSVASDIIELAPRLLDLGLRTYLNHSIFKENMFGSRYLLFLVENRDVYSDEIGTLVTFIITSLRRDLLHFARTLSSPETQSICSLLIQLTSFPGIPIHDELILEQMISFWEDLANIYIDEEGEESFNNLNGFHIQLLTQVVEAYWSKTRIPDSDVFQNIKMEFIQYRMNVADLFIVVYSLLKQPFYQTLCEGALTEIKSISLDTPNIGQLKDLENTLYLLYKITDDVLYLDSQAALLVPSIDLLFSGGFTQVIQILNPQVTDFQGLISTVIHFLASIQFYFKSLLLKNEYLGGILDFLFRILLSPYPQLSLHASRTTLKICQECRELLVEYLPTLEQLLVEMIQNSQIDHLIRQRMCNAYTSIAHSIRDPVRFGNILHKLLGTLDARAQEVVELKDFGLSLEERDDYLLSLISCVSEVGKASQIPDETDVFYNTQEQIDAVDLYWKQDPLKTRDLILHIVYQFLSNPNYSLTQGNLLVTEKCCAILKNGLGEDISGPFVFSNEVILNYVNMKIERSDIPSVSLLFGLVESVVLCRLQELIQQVGIFEPIIQHIFIDYLDFIKQDPDLVHSSLSLFASILEKKPALIVQTQLFTHALLFFLEALNAKELIVIKSALKFWLTLLALKRGTAQDQETIKNYLTNTPFGQHFVNNLVASFLSAPRSNLDYYYQVFRNLIGKYSPFAKNWLTVSLTLPEVTSGLKVDEKATHMFISKMIMSRGQRTTNDILKKYWLEANGMIEYNAKLY